MTCAICGKPISPQGRNVWRKVMGYEKVRLAGEGVHPLRERTYAPGYVHGLCLDQIAHGGTQPELAV